MELKYILISLISLSLSVFADDNHVHVEQTGSGDNVALNINQIGFDNTINFSFDHANNTFNLSQTGSGNSISWVNQWGSGKAWGGDVDGSGNTESAAQFNGATYGRHILGNNNTVNVYQSGTHTHWLDIHASDVEHDIHQSGSGSHYNHTYFYGTTSNSDTNIVQSGDGSHNSQIRIQGTEHTTLNLTQQGSTNQAYSLTQNCYTVGGCTVSVTQGN
jgi:hypothetical protein